MISLGFPYDAAMKSCDISMTPGTNQQIFASVAEGNHTAPSPGDFEFAYQSRVAMDRIRFAIRHLERFGSPCHLIREVSLELLDALDRLESVDRRFQVRSRGALSPDRNNGATQE